VSKAFLFMPQVLREAVVRTPPYMLRNVFRDSVQADIALGGGPPIIFEALKNLFDMGSLERAVREHIAIGFDVYPETDELWLKRYSSDVKQLNWLNPFAGVAAVWAGLGRLASQSEVAVRLAIYDRELARHGDKTKAQYAALEILNYGRRGANPFFRTYLATVTFMNGRIQGNDMLYRTMVSNTTDAPDLRLMAMSPDEQRALVESGGGEVWRRRRAMVFGRGMMLTFMSMLYYFFMHDEEEYKNQDPNVKDDNWLWPITKKIWLKVPIPFEAGTLFKVVPEQMAKLIMEKDHDISDVTDSMKRQIRNTMSFGLPQLAAPIVDAARNWDTYRGDYIVDPITEATIAPGEQYGMHTSNTALLFSDIAEKIPFIRNIDFLTSPEKISYMLRNFLGTAGTYVTLVADRLARSGILPGTEAENVVDTRWDFPWPELLGGEGWEEDQLANIPMLGDLFIDPTKGRRNIRTMFEISRQLTKFTGTKNRISDRDWREGMTFAQKNKVYEEFRTEIRYLDRAVASMLENKEFILKRNIDNDEKRKMIERVDTMIDRILFRVDDLKAALRQAPAHRQLRT